LVAGTSRDFYLLEIQRVKEVKKCLEIHSSETTMEFNSGSRRTRFTKTLYCEFSTKNYKFECAFASLSGLSIDQPKKQKRTHIQICNFWWKTHNKVFSWTWFDANHYWTPSWFPTNEFRGIFWLP
jgi:hypothetical protein